jgi:peptidoglycan/LPS O-acetylase OafA/YrhL
VTRWPIFTWRLHAFGSLATYEKPMSDRISPIFLQGLSISGFAMILLTIVFFDKSSPFPGVHALIPTIGTALVLGCATSETYVGRALAAKWVSGLGLLSYSAYLWHQPLFAFARIRLIEKPGLVIFGALSAIS